jgi:DNA-binding NarL/FixJ family response regulator
MARIKILLADDHTLFCNLLRELLEPEYEVVGSVADGRELLKAAETLRPDVVLVDIGMPLLNGLEAGQRLKKANPTVKLIYLTMNNNIEYAREALQGGASAFVLKNSQTSHLLQAIRGALRGVSYVAPEITQAMSERSAPNVGRRPFFTGHRNVLADFLPDRAIPQSPHYGRTRRVKECRTREIRDEPRHHTVNQHSLIARS